MNNHKFKIVLIALAATCAACLVAIIVVMVVLFGGKEKKPETASAEEEVSTEAAGSVDEQAEDGAEESSTADPGVAEVTESSDADAAEAVASAAAESVQNDDLGDLDDIGEIETEGGVQTVLLKVPAEYVEKGLTQESLDEDVNVKWLEAKLNYDGSVSYRLTRAQYDALFADTVRSIDEALQLDVDDSDLAVRSILHNSDYTAYDVTLDGSSIGEGEKALLDEFVTYAGLYGTFSGYDPDEVVINFYDVSGNFAGTVNSKEQ